MSNTLLADPGAHWVHVTEPALTLPPYPVGHLQASASDAAELTPEGVVAPAGQLRQDPKPEPPEVEVSWYLPIGHVTQSVSEVLPVVVASIYLPEAQLVHVGFVKTSLYVPETQLAHAPALKACPVGQLQDAAPAALVSPTLQAMQTLAAAAA